MKLSTYPLDGVDLEFILEIENKLKQHVGKRALTTLFVLIFVSLKKQL
ncbi:hypothetical protein [Anoxybacillus sp. TBDG-1]